QNPKTPKPQNPKTPGTPSYSTKGERYDMKKKKMHCILANWVHDESIIILFPRKMIPISQATATAFKSLQKAPIRGLEAPKNPAEGIIVRNPAELKAKIERLRSAPINVFAGIFLMTRHE
ncbi:MAG: hypothetical protein P4M11_12810, partial [Candidatus Pacebacteria bacterium]|nr:hypothetical protein [Candidatus Paceibacterota bacterium]